MNRETWRREISLQYDNEYTKNDKTSFIFNFHWSLSHNNFNKCIKDNNNLKDSAHKSP